MSDLGELLRRARAYKGVSLRDAERETRISRHYLAALEAHDFDQLPPMAYARGIVRNYAHYLGLDPTVVLQLFESASDGETADERLEVVPAVQSVNVRTHWAPNFAIIGFMLLISAIVFTWAYSAYFHPDETSQSDSATAPTATRVDRSLIDLVAKTPTVTPTPDTGQPTQATQSEPPPELADQSAPSPTQPPTEGTAEEPTQSSDPTSTPAEQTSAATTGDSESPTVTPTSDDSVGGPTGIPENVAIPEGAHLFEVYAIEEVWVQVTLNWSETPEFANVMQAGESRQFLAQTATITSGNAAYVRVFVDGEDYGTLGQPWNAVVTYP